MTTTSAKTLCPYCGVGCGLEVIPSVHPEKSNGMTQRSTHWKVRGDRAHPSSQGMVCVKGATIAEALDKSRLLYPMFRESLDQPFRIITWEDALQRLVSRIQIVLEQQGADAICMYGSGQMQTEDYYVAQKLLKGCLGTNNFDSNSRLCMSSAVSGYIQSLGSDGPPCCYEDVDLTNCAFIIGANAAECHPILYNRLQKQHKKNPAMKMIVVDPRRTPTAEDADLHLAIQPGTDIDLLNGIAYLLWQWGFLDTPFVEQHTSGFEEFVQVVRHYPPEMVASRCGITIADLETAAQWWGESSRVLSLWSMGINQSSEGTAKVRSLINLHLMTGQIGKPGAGPFSLTGQPNAMGGRETGGLSSLLPGYRQVTVPSHRAQVEQFWQLPERQISPYPGRTAWEIVTGLESGDVGLLWIVATNPTVSLPNLERTKAAFMRSPFTICQDAYYPTETAHYAHLLLPAAQWGEKTGTMTNSERVVTLCQAFQDPPGDARPDWEIFAEVGRRLGYSAKFSFSTSAEVYAEYVQLTYGRVCDVTGLSHDVLRQRGAIQWPYPATASSSQPLTKKRLYTNFIFPTLDGRAKFGAFHSRGLAEPPDQAYPFVLTTGRLYGHWHTQTRTGHIEKIRQMHPRPFIEIHPSDAEKLGVLENDWVEVRSRYGKAKFPVTLTRVIAKGTVFVPIHWGSLWAEQSEANAVTHAHSCPDSKQPELKACAVQVVPIAKMCLQEERATLSASAIVSSLSS